MTDGIRSTLEEYPIRRSAQAVVVLAFLAFFVGVVGLWRLLAFVVSVWFDGFLGLVDPAEFAIHRVHDISFALVVWAIVLGMVAQLRSPKRNVAGMWLAIVPLVALPIAFALTGYWGMLPMVGMLGAGVVLATVLHPAGRGLVTWLDVSQIRIGMLLVVVIAAVPLVAFAAGQVGLQTADHGDHDHAAGAGADADAEEHAAHVDVGHFTLMAAFGFVVIGAGLLSSLRPPGWWLPAAYAGGAVGLYGLASIVYPDHASSAGLLWGTAAVAWAVVFLVSALRSQAADTPSPYGRIEETPAPEK